MDKLLKKMNRSKSNHQNKENMALGIKRPLFKKVTQSRNRTPALSLALKNSSSRIQKSNISSTVNPEALMEIEANDDSPSSRQSSSPKIVSSTTPLNTTQNKNTTRNLPSHQPGTSRMNSSRMIKPNASISIRNKIAPSSSALNASRSSSALSVSRSLFKAPSSISGRSKLREPPFLRAPFHASKLDVSRSSHQSRMTQKMPIYQSFSGFMPSMNMNKVNSAPSVIGCHPGLNTTMSSLFNFPGRSMPQFCFERFPAIHKAQESLAKQSEQKFKQSLNAFITAPDVGDVHKMFLMEKIINHIMQTNGSCEAQRQLLGQEPIMEIPVRSQLPALPVTPAQEQVAIWLNSNEQDADTGVDMREIESNENAHCVDNVEQSAAEMLECDVEIEGEEPAEELAEEQLSPQIQKLSGKFALKDWTLVLGDGPTELKVSGSVVQILLRTILEENHVSDPIIEVVNNMIVKTETCTYVLTGRICNPNNQIPEMVIKNFKKMGFPKNWKDICKQWHAYNDAGTPSNGRRTNARTTTAPKRPRGNNELPSTPVSRHHRVHENTIITRSVSKKLKQRHLGAFKLLCRDD